MNRVFLIGFMGSGKSTVGKLVADRLDLPVIDLDERIVEHSGKPIPEIFAEDGEDAFRAIEHEVLAETCVGPDAVIACGGGVILRDENRALMRRCGTVVYLDVSAEEAVARIGDTAGRPLLAGDAAQMARTILAARLSLYRATAHHVVGTAGRDANEVADEVLAVVRGTAVEVVPVHAGDGYEVRVGVGILDSLGEAVAGATGARRVAVVTDSNVGSLLGDRVLDSLEAAGIDAVRFVVSPGESSKSWTQAENLLESFASAGLDRGSAVVAVGGGVVGDLAGFCAATYMRGIALVHVPTTLLAQVDSSIGGKTGVDLAAGKNLAGAFWQPSLVLTDIALLQTLPEAEWANGLSEVVKTAFLQGEDEVRRLEADAPRLRARDELAVREAVLGCIHFKARVVSDDERESGIRECLNLGHTLGHAIEKVAGYGSVAHGVAVAAGMRFAARLAGTTLGTPTELETRIALLQQELGIPELEGRLDPEALMTAMMSDKKSRDSVVRFVFLRSPGEWVVEPAQGDVLMGALVEWSAGLKGEG